MNNFAAIVEKIKSMPVMELVELNKALKEALGISDDMLAGPAVAVAASGAASAEAAQPVKTSFDVILKDAGGNKIAVIKSIKEILGCGLKEAKDFAEASGSVIKAGVSKDESEKIVKQLTEAGAVCAIQ